MRPVTGNYVHGYDDAARARLMDQASSLESLLHTDTNYPAGSVVLEAGCGVGAQTVPLARNSAGAQIVSVDVSRSSLAEAAARVADAGLTNVRLLEADIFDLPFEPGSFDHIFVCFVLEHLPAPVEALARLKALIRPAGTLTVIEGDHGSVCFHPDDGAARAAVRALVDLQRLAGGDANIGRRLHPLLKEAGFADVRVSPRMVYVDETRPDLAESFTRRTFTAMIEGARAPAIEAGLIAAEIFEEGLQALHRAAEPDGVFCYTFFKATALAASGHGLQPR